MWGRSKSPVEQAADAASDLLGDVKVGAVKGAAAGALGVLGAKAADMAQSTRDDLAPRARKAQKQAGKTLAQAADTAGKAAQEAAKRAGKTSQEAAKKAGKTTQQAAKQADVQAKTDAMTGMLQMLGRRAGSAAQGATDGGLHVDLDVNDVPRLLRGFALVATGLATLFAPGSALDVSRRIDLDTDQITGQIADQARQGIDTAADVTQQRVKDLIDLAKDALSSLSDSLTSGVETAESRLQEALDETESRLSQVTEQAAGKAKGTVPRKKGGTLRWAFYGLLAGGLVGFLSSPFSGPLGERVMNLRRDLGLGGDEDDDSQYWPSPPQETSGGDTTGTQQAEGGGDFSPLGKTENWTEGSGAKESPDKE